MIDIHNHILFDIDDGAQTVEDSIALCSDAYENGYKAIICTPHFHNYKNIRGFIEIRDEKADLLREALKEEGIPLSIFTGAELFLSDDIFNAGDLDGLTLNNSRYILCEFPLGPFNASRITRWIDELILRGYTPIVAHPERYFEFHRNPKIIDKLLDREVLFQVNIDSLVGKYGTEQQEMGTDMIKRKIAILLGTDAHDCKMRHTRFNERLAEMPDEITDEMLEACTKFFPKLILENKDIF